jgi:hypothetical protein
VPGYVYAPAWVDFHVGAAGYVGWAPLAPRYVWRSGAFVSVGLWGPPPVVFCPTRYVFVRSMPRYVVRDRVRVRSMAAQTRVYRGPRYLSGNYVARGPSPAELRIPRSALPERRVEYRRVIAEPRVTARTRTSGRLQLADGARSGARSDAHYRSRETRPQRQLPSRERSYQAAPRGYDGGRGYSDGGRAPAGRGYSERERSGSEGARGYSGRGSSGRTHDRPEMLRQSPGERRMDSRGASPGAQRGSMWGGERREPSRGAAPRAQPQAPAAAPRERPRSAYGQDRGRGAARSGAPPAVQHRAPRPAPDTRSNGRRQRRDDSSAGDSRNRGRERYGSGR